ncbi:hypothetical protein, partial [Escherichia coli]|uniref:hypothetical protein n=1 Tax=Escherichia coli TaxID=562 RepID=UPI003B99F568
NLTPNNLMGCLNAGEKRAQKIIKNIQETQTCDFKNWVLAFGFLNIGPQKAQALCENITSFNGTCTFSKI